MKHIALTLALLAPTAACGDNLAGPGSGGDAGVPDAAPDGQLAGATAFAVAPDYENGVGIASTIELPSLAVETNVVAGAISSDPAVRVIGDRIYVINRFGFDNLTILEQGGFALVEQVSTGEDTNPQDVARAAGKLYVAAHDNAPGLLVFDESDLAAGVIATIDLSELDPDDGEPDCNSVIEVGDLIVAACGVLDETSIPFTPRGPGAIAVIDPDTDTVITTFELTHANPLSLLVASDPTGPLAADVLVATAPSFSDYSSGCIERIGIGTDPAPLGCLVDNSELGGYVSTLAVVDDGLVATVNTCVDDDCFTTTAKLVAISPSGEIGAPLPGGHVTDVVRCPNGALVASDTDFANQPGVRVYHDGVELTDDPLDIGLPPAFANGLACY